MHALISVTLFGFALLMATAQAQTTDVRRFQPTGGKFPAQVLLESKTGRCTANVVSRQGHLLTARHCLQNCLTGSGVFQFHRDPSGHYILNLNPEKLGVAECSVQINGQEAKVVVEGTAPGFVAQLDETSFRSIARDRFFELVEQGYTSRGDFAVVRWLNPPQNLKCMKLSQNPVRPHDPVFSAGYPTKTERPDGQNSDGIGQFQTEGRVISSIEKNLCLQEWQNSADPQAYQKRLQSLKEDFDDRDGFMSDLDAIYGASGSGVWNENSEIVGVLTNVYRHSAATRRESDEPENRYCAGSTRSISTERIFELLSKMPGATGAQNWRQLLSCE